MSWPLPRRLPRRRPLPTVVVGVVGFLAIATPASAQWYFGGGLGGNHNQSAAVSIRVPASNLDLKFHDVEFGSQRDSGRLYYDMRLGRFLRNRRFGFELEFVHYKTVADVTRTYDVTAGAGSVVPPAGTSPMNAVVQEFMMTHGVNLATVNLVVRERVGNSRLWLMARGGGGVIIPHGETTVNGAVVHEYQYGGPGAHGAGGIEVEIIPRLSALAEYKLTWAGATIDVAPGGEGSTTVLSHHFVFGLTVAITK
jgi:hypothetical protein